MKKLFIIGIILFYIYGCNGKSKPKEDHSQNGAYKSGYAAGQLANKLGGASYCSDNVIQENEPSCVTTECKDLWCEGYNEGYLAGMK